MRTRGRNPGGGDSTGPSIPMSTFIPHSDSSIRYLMSRSKYLLNNKYSFNQRNRFLPKPKAFHLICVTLTLIFHIVFNISKSSSWKLSESDFHLISKEEEKPFFLSEKQVKGCDTITLCISSKHVRLKSNHFTVAHHGWTQEFVQGAGWASFEISSPPFEE